MVHVHTWVATRCSRPSLVHVAEELVNDDDPAAHIFRNPGLDLDLAARGPHTDLIALLDPQPGCIVRVQCGPVPSELLREWLDVMRPGVVTRQAPRSGDQRERKLRNGR